MSLHWEKHCDGEISRRDFCKKNKNWPDYCSLESDIPTDKWCEKRRNEMDDMDVGEDRVTDTFEGFSTPSVFNVQNLVKYLIEGLAVAICAMLIPKKALGAEEIMIIALTAAATFSILDVFIPAMGSSARNGAGLTLGSTLVGGLRIAA